MSEQRPDRVGRACASAFRATASPKRLAAAALALVVLSSVAIAGSSASTTPVPKAGTHASLKPVPAGTKVHTVSAKRATATFNSRLRARGGHAVAVKPQITLTFHGVGTKDPTATVNNNTRITLTQPAAPTATAGVQMPLVGSGQPVLAAAPLAPASNKLSPRDMRILVIAADGKETDLGAIKADLDSVGIPYTVLTAATTPLTDAMLWDGVGHGYYQGVILTTNSLTYSPDGIHWQSAFTDAEFQTLWNYESSFGVRQVTSYTAAFGWPETLGLSAPVATVDTTTTPLSVTLTPAGQTVFNYLNPNINLSIGNAWVYESTITDPATTTALMTSSTGYPIITTHTSADGRENLAVTAANAYYLRHSQVLGYGLVNWVTKGLFLGKKRISVTPQEDDLFIDNDQWDVNANSDLTGQIYRTTASDWQALINWQNGVHASSPLLSAVRLEFPFNGEGTTGIYTPDTLTNYVYTHASGFSFVNHTWSHQNLDYANNESGAPTSAKTIHDEIQQNHTLASKRQFPNYYKDAMVQPDISGLNTAVSGLNNDLAQQTAYDLGIRYWISDTSRPGWNNPSPNTGFWAQAAPGLLIIPRHPTNIFYNVSTPAQVVDEYNFYYAPGGAWHFWPSPRTYDQIIDTESDNLLAYMLQGDNDPWMFHTSNWRAYDGVHSVLGDLLTATFNKYRLYYNLPVLGPNEHQLGVNMTQWMGYKASGVQATLTPCASITLTDSTAAAIPITGLTYGTSGDTYNGQRTSNVTVTPGLTATVPLPATGC